MSKLEKIQHFDPSGVGLKNDHFIGLPFEEEEAEVVLLPVPWDVTVSYADGTAGGPENILEASSQLDLLDPFVPDAWKMGLYMRPPSEEVRNMSLQVREDAKNYIDLLENGTKVEDHSGMQQTLRRINQACEEMVNWVRKQSKEIMENNKIVGLVGGDHSTPLGYLQALGERFPSFSILQIDAHMDLRKAYEGFLYSHASVFYNALSIPSVKKLVQVGIRDYCEEEIQLVEQQKERIQVFYDHGLKASRFSGQAFQEICDRILDGLGENVYISFDIDGLQPFLCPHTGTPVPGGLQFEEAVYLLERLVEKGHRIIGFDLCEVAGKPHEWDGNVGARLLYKMANLAGRSNDKI
jgi:agmatinase